TGKAQYRCATRSGRELQVYSVTGWVRYLEKREDDGDWHIELTRASDSPRDSCTVADIPPTLPAGLYGLARADLDRLLAGPAAAPSPKPAKDCWDKLDVFGKLVSGIVLFIIAMLVQGLKHLRPNHRSQHGAAIRDPARRYVGQDRQDVLRGCQPLPEAGVVQWTDRS